ncbi:stage V sporulation protein B [Bacillus marinisedimentorum]|uniref:stage V sporulation protein B n=1 Tax=Bacillus marinisedimentorum TaxID=1821260 RepID=UPI000872F9F2|nr:stage V sporulation protein B [Bacillus marinisedimentorum]
MTKQTFLQGTIILMAAGLITRLLGFVNRIVVARIMGEEGVGLYMMAIPTLILTITLTQFGLPVAISKLVAEAEAQGDDKKIKRILVVSLAITGTLSVIFTTGMILLAPLLSKTLLTDSRTLLPLLAISPIVPIVALSAVLRGYFQGRQNMKPGAYSMVIEQVVRITLVAVLAKMFLPYGVEYAAAGAMVSVVFGELASLLYMLTMFKLKKRMKVRRNFFKEIKSSKPTFVDLMGIAMPTTGSRLIGSLSFFFEPIIVSQSLAIAGVTTAVATRQYGELTGYALPLMFLPSFITHSLAVSLVPAISEAAAKNQPHLIEHRLQQALRLSMVSGGLAIVVLYVFAGPLLEMMYGSSSAVVFIKVMAPFFIFYYFQGPLQAALQALDLARAAMVNSLIGNVVKLAAIFALATRPELGIMGAALAIVIGTLLVTLLHFATIIKAIGYTVYLKNYLKVFVTIIISGGAGFFYIDHFFQLFSKNASTVIGVTVTCLVYLMMLIYFQLIKRDEVAPIPVIGRGLARLFKE